MAHTVRRLARGNTAKLNAYAGPAGELCMDTQTNELVLQNGAKGGVRFKPGGGTTYAVFSGASASSAGKSGLVPAPAKGEQGLFLCGNGEWASPANTTYGVVTATANGLMTPDMLAKLNGIAVGANKYTLPAATATTLGGIMVPTNAHLTLTSAGALSLTKQNVIDALGYTPGTGSGGEYTLPAATATTLGGVKVPTNAHLTLSSGALSLTKQNVIDALGYTPGTGGEYTLPAATTTTLGGVKVPANANLTLTSAGALSLTKQNVTDALGYTPPTQDTTYGVVTSTTNGLMTPAMLAKLNSAGGVYSLHGTYEIPINDFSQDNVSVTCNDSNGWGSAVLTITITGLTANTLLLIEATGVYNSVIESGTVLALSVSSGGMVFGNSGTTDEYKIYRSYGGGGVNNRVSVNGRAIILLTGSKLVLKTSPSTNFVWGASDRSTPVLTITLRY